MNEENATGRVTLYPDGVYRWTYDYNLYRNPVVLILICKIFAFILLGMWLFMLTLELGSRHFMREAIRLTESFALFAGGFLLLVLFGYFVYAFIMGGKYCVIFEMDEQGILHRQMDKQFKRAQAASLLAVLGGLAAKSPGAAGSGLLAATRSSIYSTFSKIKSVELIEKHDTIKVSETLGKNQVYVHPGDFAFVRDYILARVPQKVREECKINT